MIPRSKKELKIIYNLLTERRIEQGMDATTSLDYLLDIYKEYGDNLDILVAKHDSDYISGLVTLYYKNHLLSIYLSRKLLINL